MLVFFLPSLMPMTPNLPTTDFHPTDLRCEFITDPLALDTAHPRLSWRISTSKRGWKQSAYQLVAEEPGGKTGSLWDTGKVASSQSIGIEYHGKPLRSHQAIVWRVRVWDSTGSASDMSGPARFETGLLAQEDWKAQWITSPTPLPEREEDFYKDRPMPLFRKEFTVKHKPVRARLYVSGLGYYEARLNTRRVGDRLLDPAWTDYSKRILYSVYDVTNMIREGRNAVGIMLGSGWYDPLPLPLFGRWNLRKELPVGKPRAILRLDLEFADGSRQAVTTDTSWKVADGPVLRNSVYLGETYDARREQRGWDGPGFGDAAWAPAIGATEKVGPLHAQMIPPIRKTREVRPIKLTEPKPGAYVFDLGQNFAGWVSFTTRGPAGTTVKIRLGELLHPDGMVNVFTSCMTQIKKGAIRVGHGAPETAEQSETYILRGEGEEQYAPHFTFHGFRYVEVTGLAEKPTLDTIVGHRLNSDVASTGSFQCSDDLFNRIQEAVRWTMLSNMFSVESDCPHREKLGYGGDIVAASEMAMLNFDMSRFYAKAVQDFADAVRPNGGLTETAPFVGIADEGLGDGSGPIGWGTAYPLLAWQLRQYYGDSRTMAEQYEGVKRYVKLLQSTAIDGILDNGISDHESLVPKPRALTGTAFYYLNVELAAKMAHALGRTDEAKQFETLAASIKEAFIRRFFNYKTGQFDSGTQACQSFALHFGLVPDDFRQKTLDALLQDITGTHKGHVSTGIFGTKYMLEALTDLDRADVAYTMSSQKTFPGWGYMLENGATTLWETWKREEFIYSHNHPMFGSISEWFFKALGGIQPAPDAVGFDKIIIRPNPVGDLQWVKCRYDSVRGPIVCDWQVEGDHLSMNVRIPANTEALVYVPTSLASSVTEGDKPAAKVSGVSFLRQDGGRAVFRVGGGEYRFRAQR